MPVAAGSVKDALAAATDAIAAAGVDTPRLDAELLLAEATGLDRARLAAEPEAEVGAAAGRAFGEMVRRRVRREPVAYILGRKAFRNIELAVDRRALVPRPETEALVEVALELRPLTVLDVGTGSGAVALAVADELPEANVTATDVSEDALDLARANAERLGLADSVRLIPGSVPEDERFELALANLPYVRDDEWAGLGPEITRYEPREALVAGPTGTEAIAEVVGRVVADAVAVEVGAGQADDVVRLVRDAGFKATDVRDDLAGVDRIVVGKR